MHYAPLFLKVALVSLAAAVCGWAVGVATAWLVPQHTGWTTFVAGPRYPHYILS